MMEQNTDNPPPKRHRMYAQVRPGHADRPDWFGNPNYHLRTTRLFGTAFPIVPVIVTERPDVPVPTNDFKRDQYIGWVRYDDEGKGEKLSLIQPCFALFSMQFPGGGVAEQRMGRGHMVCLDIEQTPEGWEGDVGGVED
jgi:hypothetical protein